MYELVALDVDGTLLNDRYELSDFTAVVIQALASKGIKFVLCTGRSPASLRGIRERLNIFDSYIVHNGSSILDARGNTLYARQYPVEYLTQIIEFCRKENLHFNVCTVHDVFVETSGYEEQYEKYLLNPFRVADILSLKDGLVKFSIYAEEKKIDYCLTQDWMNNDLLSIVRVGSSFIDVMLKGGAKGEALQRFAESIGCAREKIVALGDQNNDIEMLRFAGVGIAMGNASEDLIKVCDWQTDSNNEDGVAKALLKLFHLTI